MTVAEQVVGVQAAAGGQGRSQPTWGPQTLAKEWEPSTREGPSPILHWTKHSPCAVSPQLQPGDCGQQQATPRRCPSPPQHARGTPGLDFAWLMWIHLPELIQNH